MANLLSKVAIGGLLLLSLSAHNGMAQYLTYFQHTNRYMFWPVPPAPPAPPLPLSQSSDAPKRGILGWREYPAGSNILLFDPFNFTHAERDSTRTIHGVAIAASAYINEDGLDMWSILPYRYENCIWTDCSIDVYMYKITEGDSAMELLKHASFNVPKGKRPDREMVIRDSYTADGITFDSLRTYLHDFYFDRPVTVTGPFIIAIQSSATMMYATFSLSVLSGVLHQYWVYDHCSPGYLGLLNTSTQSILSEISCKTSAYNVKDIFPDIEADSIMTDKSQFIYPILVPEGDVSVEKRDEIVTNVRITPNPAKTHMTVEADNAIAGITVTDMTGRTLITKEYPRQELSATLNISTLPNGIYSVTVQTVQGSTTKKLLVD